MPDAPVTKEMSTEASQPEKVETPKEDEPEPTVSVQNGRRRGKRRVMKKKTVKDEEGYLGRHDSIVIEYWLTISSDQRRGGMGIVLRRRA